MGSDDFVGSFTFLKATRENKFHELRHKLYDLRTPKAASFALHSS